ncbi:hypothetical protein JHK82_042976 [Glycine max]|nr:hypothetical protein JHK87_042915 [Glycine soja]KAG4949755.1 hypothetical protein JHK86_042994 [Glycine max]KAG5106006.1 hypothetical protein JHK82_042976 [Glycine max]KAG5117075.1 hypothetical protein JHK84_043188 [Glycine max]
MDETPEASNAVIAYEIVHHDKELASKQSTTSNEATLREKGEPDVVIVYSTISRPTPLNYAPPADFKLSMQNAITTQFSNLGVVLLQNLQRDQMSMLGAIVASKPTPIPVPPTLKPTPPPPPTQPPPPSPAQD